jgi:hypothetical protein
MPLLGLKWRRALALLLLSPACARVLHRQQGSASSIATAEATTTYAVSVQPTTNNAPTATFSSNVTTTAAPAATGTLAASTFPTKHYKFEFTKGWVDTNGNPRQAILINGQTPGPLIEVEEGQELTVRGFIHERRTLPNIAFRLKLPTISTFLVPCTPMASSSHSVLGRTEFPVLRSSGAIQAISMLIPLPVQAISHRSRSDLQLHLHPSSTWAILVGTSESLTTRLLI